MTAEKDVQVARKRGGGEEIWAMPERKHSFLKEVFPNTSGTTYNWPNLEPMQVAFYLAGEITQVKESIPWVRCASGNVFPKIHRFNPPFSENSSFFPLKITNRPLGTIV